MITTLATNGKIGIRNGMKNEKKGGKNDFIGIGSNDSVFLLASHTSWRNNFSCLDVLA